MTIFLKTLSSSDAVLNKMMNTKCYCLLCVKQMVNHSLRMNENKSLAKVPNFWVTLEIFLIFPGLLMFFHSCVTQLIVNLEVKIIGQFSIKTVMLSAWEWALSHRRSENKNQKKRIISYGRKWDSVLFAVTSFTIPGNGRRF